MDSVLWATVVDSTGFLVVADVVVSLVDGGLEIAAEDVKRSTMLVDSNALVVRSFEVAAAVVESDSVVRTVVVVVSWVVVREIPETSWFLWKYLYAVLL